MSQMAIVTGADARLLDQLRNEVLDTLSSNTIDMGRLWKAKATMIELVDVANRYVKAKIEEDLKAENAASPEIKDLVSAIVTELYKQAHGG